MLKTARTVQSVSRLAITCYASLLSMQLQKPIGKTITKALGAPRHRGLLNQPLLSHLNQGLICLRPMFLLLYAHGALISLDNGLMNNSEQYCSSCRLGHTLGYYAQDAAYREIAISDASGTR